MSRHTLAHFRIERFKSESTYSRPNQDFSGLSSGRNRDIHGPKLVKAVAAAIALARERATARDSTFQSGIEGIYLEVGGMVDGPPLPDLNWPSQRIRLSAIRVTENETQVGVLFVPASAEAFGVTSIKGKSSTLSFE